MLFLNFFYHSYINPAGSKAAAVKAKVEPSVTDSQRQAGAGVGARKGPTILDEGVILRQRAVE